MNVVGIVQTDLNEFNILFEETQQQHGQQDGQNQQGQEQGQANGDQEDDMFSFFTLDNSGSQQGQGKQNQGKSQNRGDNLQEMTVRIKGIPEGQKATFLQMYQVIQDAKQVQDLEQNLTIVNRYDNQQGQNGNGQKSQNVQGNEWRAGNQQGRTTPQ